MSVTDRIDALPRKWAQRTPHAIAIRDGTRAVTWRALADAIDACARHLAGSGVRAGDRVVIVAENSLPQVASLFAASTLDACAVPVNPRLSPRELEAIRDHAQPRATVYAIGIAPEIDAHAQRHGASAVDVDGIGSLAVSAASATGSALEGVAALVYTTGTTGQPKGVMLTHGNLMFVAGVSAALRELGPGDRVYGALPIYHVYGLASMLLGAFTAGACLHVVPRFDARRALDAMAHDGITIVQGVPAMYTRMLEQLAGDARAVAPHVRYLYAGGSPLDPALKREVESRFGLALHNGYGLTETSPTVSQTRLDAPRADTSVGPPIPGIEVRIVDATGRDVPPGAVGELWVRGPNVMRGYYRDPEATARAITPEGWLRTGDLARQDVDAALFIVGRSKDLIIRSGLNVYPGEVEAVLNAHPAVAQSVVVGRTVAGGNEEVVAFVELAAGRTATAEDLREHAASQLAPYKRPGEIRIMRVLPASATGKILRGRLKELAATSASP